MDRRVVVLPQPLGPSKVRSCPVSTSKETLSTAATDAPRSASNCFLSPVTRNILSSGRSAVAFLTNSKAVALAHNIGDDSA